MRLTDMVNVRGVKMYSFDDNHGVSVHYEMVLPANTSNEVGYLPIKHTFQCDNSADAKNIFDKMFPIVPGEYKMTFELTPGSKGQMRTKILDFMYSDNSDSKKSA